MGNLNLVREKELGFPSQKRVVVVVVNILFQTKKTALMIGHCTALAVIVTKTLAGKISELKQEKEESLLHLMSWCDNQRGASTSRFHN